MQEAPEVFMALIALLQNAEALRHEGVRRIAGGHGAAATGDRLDGGRGRGGRLRQRGARRRGMTELLDAGQNGLLVEVILDAHILRTRETEHCIAMNEQRFSHSLVNTSVRRSLILRGGARSRYTYELVSSRNTADIKVSRPRVQERENRDSYTLLLTAIHSFSRRPFCNSD